MRGGADGGLPVKLRRDADVEAALVGFLRLRPLLLAQGQIVVHRAVKIAHKLLRGGTLIGNEGADALDLSKKNSVNLRELNASHIILVFHCVVQIKPSCSKISMSCFT